MSSGLNVLQPYRPRGFKRSPLRDTLYKPDSVLRHGPQLRHLASMAARGLLPHATGASFDLHAVGLNLPIRDQGQCGSCWDFSGCRTATGALIWAGVGSVGSFYLSEQSVLDCGQNGGCGGDDNVTVLQMCKAQGLPTDAYGPYTAGSGRCNLTPSDAIYKIADWGFCDGSGNGVTATQAIKNCLVWYGIVGCGVDASDFDSYSGGVMTGNVDSGSIDHDVTITGWQDDASTPGGGWWWVDNSWGSSWGIGGRCKMAYGAWGIGTEAIFAIGTAGMLVAPVPTWRQAA